MVRSLTYNEHRDIVSRIKNGDKGVLEEYLAYYYPVIDKIINALNINENDLEDVRQAGIEGILIGIKNYSLDVKTPVYNYILKAIILNIIACSGYYLETYKTAITNIVNGNYKENMQRVITEIQNKEKNFNLSIDSNVKNFDENTLDEALIKVFASIISGLTSRERDIFCSYSKIFGYDASVKSLISKYNVSKSRVQEIRRDVEDKIRDNYILQYIMQNNLNLALNTHIHDYYSNTLFKGLYRSESLKECLTPLEISIFASRRAIWDKCGSKFIFKIISKVLSWQYSFITINDIVKEITYTNLLTDYELLFFRNIKNKSLLELVEHINAEYIFGYFIPRLISVRESKDMSLKRTIK